MRIHLDCTFLPHPPAEIRANSGLVIEKDNKEHLQTLVSKLFYPDQARIFDIPALHVYVASEQIPEVFSASAMNSNALGLGIVFKRNLIGRFISTLVSAGTTLFRHYIIYCISYFFLFFSGFDAEFTYCYNVAVVNSPLEDPVFEQSNFTFVFFASKKSPIDIMVPILKDLYAGHQGKGKVIVSEQYFPAATFLDEKDQGPVGLDFTNQLSTATWQEIFLRFVPQLGSFRPHGPLFSSILTQCYRGRQ